MTQPKRVQHLELNPQNSAETAESIQSQFDHWRFRILYSLIFGYASFYLVRQNFSMAIPSITAEFGYTNTELGLIMTIWTTIYGLGKFISGYVSDRSNARTFMTLGLAGSALTCLVMGFGSALPFFGVMMVFNACFQSMGWPPVTRLLTHWYSPKELGTKWAITACSHQIGGAIIVIFAGYLIEYYGWRTAFFLPAIVAMGLAVLLYNRLRDTPESMGLPSIEKYKELKEAEDVDDTAHLSQKKFILMVLSNKLLWYVCFGNMFLYAVRMGVLNWAPTFLHQHKGSSILSSGWQVATFDICGLAGGLAAGWFSDRIFSGRRGPVSVLYMVALTGALFYFWMVPAGYQWLDTLSMAAVGFLVYGPQVLAGVATADFGTKRAAGMANGLAGTFAYVFGAGTAVVVGWLSENWGWDSVFIFFICSSILGAISFALTWHARSRVLD